MPDVSLTLKRSQFAEISWSIMAAQNSYFALLFI
jgi:hypothetical protein